MSEIKATEYKRILGTLEDHTLTMNACFMEATKELHKTVREVISHGMERGRTWEQINKDAQQVATVYKLASLTLLVSPLMS